MWMRGCWNVEVEEARGQELTILAPTLKFTQKLEPHINQNRERQV